MCEWKSENGQQNCTRNNFNDSKFCLYHKPNKTEAEARLFWRIINWNVFALFSSNDFEMYFKPWEWSKNQQKQLYISEKIEVGILSQFGDEERNHPNFNQIKDSVLNEENNSKIWNPNLVRSDFSGFRFPSSYTQKFEYARAIRDNGFGVMDFSEAVFEGAVIFDNYIFHHQVTFNNCRFNGGVRFYGAKFKRRATFINAEFSNNFLGTEGRFEEAVFSGNEVIFTSKTKCGAMDFKGIQFGQYTTFNIDGLKFDKDFGVASYGELAYRIAKIQSNKIGDNNKAADYYYLEKCFRGFQIMPTPYFWDERQKGFKKLSIVEYVKNDKPQKYIFEKIVDLIAKYTIGYGERPLNAFISSGVIIIGFAFLHMLLSDISIGGKIVDYEFVLNSSKLSMQLFKEFTTDYLNCLYFSIVTFTTVGYGDITPQSGVGKFLSGSEMLLGVTFVGAWTATLLRKFVK